MITVEKLRTNRKMKWACIDGSGKTLSRHKTKRAAKAAAQRHANEAWDDTVEFDPFEAVERDFEERIRGIDEG